MKIKTLHSLQIIFLSLSKIIFAKFYVKSRNNCKFNKSIPELVKIPCPRYLYIFPFEPFLIYNLVTFLQMNEQFQAKVIEAVCLHQFTPRVLSYSSLKCFEFKNLQIKLNFCNTYLLHY